MIRKLSKMPYAQAYTMHYDDNSMTLVSYYTQVIHIDSDGWLTCSGTYSATTRKHISAFMQQYTNFDYYTAKNAYTNNVKVNIYTGEVCPNV